MKILFFVQVCRTDPYICARPCIHMYEIVRQQTSRGLQTTGWENNVTITSSDITGFFHHTLPVCILQQDMVGFVLSAQN